MRVLIYVHSPTWFTELSLLGRYLQSTGHEPVFFVSDFKHWTMHHIAGQLAADGIPCILACDTPPARTNWVDDRGLSPSGASRKLDRQLARGLRGWLFRTDPQTEGQYRRDMRELANAIADYDAALKIEPKLAEALYGRGVARKRNGDSADGEADIAAAKAIKADAAEEFAQYGVQ